MKRWLIILLVLAALLAGTLAAGWWWLTTTRSGAAFILNQAGQALPGLRWQRLEGGLRGGIVLHDVVLDDVGARISVRRLELAARVSLPPGARVEVSWLRAHDVDIHLLDSEPAAPRETPFELPDLASPIPIEVAELRISELRLHPSADDAVPIMVQRIELRAQYFRRLELEMLQVVMPDGQLNAEGHWGLSTPFDGQLNVAAEYRGEDFPGHRVRLALSGPLADLAADFETDGPLSAAGRLQLQGLPDLDSGDIELSGRFSDWPDLDLTVDALDLRARGTLDDWQARLSARFDGFELPPGDLAAELRGSDDHIDVDQLRIGWLDGRIEADGSLTLQPDLQGRLRLRLDGLDPAPLLADWPQPARLQGQLEINTDGQAIILDSLELSAPPAALAVRGDGRFLPEQDELALDLRWRELAWPPLASPSAATVYSENGRLRLSGRLSDWRLELDALLRALGQPQGSIEASAVGDSAQARIERLALDLDPIARARLSGEVRWDPDFSGRLQLALDDADPGHFIAELPGQINSRLALTARSLTDLSLEISSIDGTLRGQPLLGDGRVSISDERPEAGELNLSVGANRLRIDSSDGRSWHWSLDADALHQLWPDLGGRLNLAGQFNPFEQRVDASGSLEEAGLSELSLERATLTAELSWDDPPRADVSLELLALDLNPWERIETLTVNLNGSCRGHRFGLAMDAGRARLALDGAGEIPDCLRGGERWSGDIEGFELTETLAGDWTLNQALPLSIEPRLIAAGPGCLVQSNTRDGRICLRQLRVDGESRVDIGIEQVPMDLLLLPLDPAFNLTTPLSGELAAAWQSGFVLESLSGFLALDAGALTPIDGDDELIVIDGVRLDIAPQGDGFVLDLDARFEGDSRLGGQARLGRQRALDEARIDASARLNLPDIGVFNRLVAELDQLGGRLEADLTLSGQLLAPTVDGQARLHDGLIVHAPLGLKISDIELQLDGANDRAELSGQMRSGEGSLRLAGTALQQDQQWQLGLDLDGERFAVADVDWLRLAASPRIRLDSRNGQLEVDGDIRIDRLRAGLPPGAEERVGESSDIVVRGELDEADEATVERLRGRLGIDLGNDARLAALGMQTSLAGGIELLWEPTSAVPRGRGLIRLPSGSYRAYGQNLEIRDGEVLFTGHPLDNPRLDIRAVRDIFGDPQVDEAGVHIRGNARDPIITLFTEPPTSEEKALAYVITGANFDHAGGQAAFNVGFYLLPRLFVSYGIGLFESGNVLSGRFELSRRWGVRVVSGERDTGVDLSFAIDR